MVENFQFLNPRQAALHADLQKIGDWPAAAFRDASQFFAPDNPAATLETAAHLAVHLQREMKSALVSVLAPLDFKAPKEADRDAAIADVIRASGAEEARIPAIREALRAFDLRKASKSGDRAAIETILEIFGLPSDHELATLWVELGKLHDRAHRNALSAPRRLDDVRQTWEVFQHVTALLLHHLDAAWSTVVYKRLDEILAVPQPGAQQLRDLRNRIPNNQHTFRYFFERANSDAWVDTITRNTSLFTAPPDAGPWAAIQYLLNIAPTHPDDVHRILMELPPTPNVLTHMVLTQIAGALPPHLAKDVIARESRAIVQREIGNSFFAADVAKHAATIVTAETASAIAVIQDLLRLQPATGTLRDLESPLDLHTYVEVVSAARSIWEHDPEPTYAALADLLDEALGTVYKEPGEDNSSVWMPAIEPHEQNHQYEPLPVLAAAVRDAAEALIAQRPDAVDDLVTGAESRGWFFFRRLALHLLRHQPQTQVAKTHAQRGEILQNYALKHEAHLFLRSVFPHLSQEEKEQIIERISNGPSICREERFETPAQRQEYIDWWIAQRLSWVKEWLTTRAREDYDRLVQNHQEPTEEDDFVAVMGTMWVGPTSPKTGEELMTMSIPDVLAFLRTWNPGPRKLFDHSREGVARELQKLATERPTEIAAAAREMRDLDSAYIRGILNGLQSAVQNKRPILDWASIIELAAHVVAQPREIKRPADDPRDGDDPHWGWARAAIARLFDTGFRAGEATIPIRFREEVFAVLLQALDDPDPAPAEDDARDPMNVALNSTRGQAFRAIVLYGLWVRRSDQQVPRTFDDMPEVREVLVRVAHSEESAGVRAVMGELLHIMHALDPGWVREYRDDLFPSNALGDAVFHTYITNGQPTLEIDLLLKPEFDRAIVAVAEGQNSPPRYADHLARHVMWLYASDEATLNPHGLVERFMAAAAPEDRAYAVGFAPTAVDDCTQDDATFCEKLQRFWEWCARREDLAPMQRGFGQWFDEERLDISWRLGQLEHALTVAAGVARDFEIMELLAEITSSQPVPVLRCARLLFDSGEYFSRYHWVHEGSIRRIIVDALASENAEAQDAARSLANHLVGHGFDEFLDLAR
jgi:hypothetical protein